MFKRQSPWNFLNDFSTSSKRKSDFLFGIVSKNWLKFRQHPMNSQQLRCWCSYFRIYVPNNSSWLIITDFLQKALSFVFSLNFRYFFQQILGSKATWSYIKLQINKSKFFMMSFTRKREANYQHFDYNIDGSLIQKVNGIRELGVIFDSKLSFNNHFEIIINRSQRMLGFFSRSLEKFKNIKTYIMLYNCSR